MLSHQRSANALFQNNYSRGESQQPLDSSPSLPKLYTEREKSRGRILSDFDGEHPHYAIPTLYLPSYHRIRQLSQDAIPKRSMEQVNKLLMLATPVEQTIDENTKHSTGEDNLIRRVKRQLESIFDQYKLSKISLTRVQSSVNQQDLFESMIELFRVCLYRNTARMQSNKSMGSLAATSETDKQKTETMFLKETNEVLRDSQAWAKKKLQEMKDNWKEACEKVIKLQGLLEQRQSEVFNLRRHERHTQRFISHMQQRFRQLNQHKEASLDLMQAHTKLTRAHTDTQLQKQDMKRLLQQKGSFIAELQQVIAHKDRELEHITHEFSRLRDKYRALKGHKKLNKQLLNQQRLLSAAERFREKYSQNRVNHHLMDSPKLSQLLKRSTESRISRNSSDQIHEIPQGVSPPHRWHITPSRERSVTQPDALE